MSKKGLNMEQPDWPGVLAAHEAETAGMTVIGDPSGIVAGNPTDLPAASGWRPIETAPKDGTEIDVWVQFYRDEIPAYGERIVNAAWGDEHEGWVDEDGDPLGWQDKLGKKAVVTHWMPLPAPPSDTDTGSAS